MILAYSAPRGWNRGPLIAYAAITNVMLMTIYSMNNMPYAALGGVMTGDVNERASLNSFRFIAVNAAQFIVGGLTLPLVAKFAAGHDRQYGWRMTMTIWAVLCLVLFVITFATTRERIKPPPTQHSSPAQDFGDLFKNSPWAVMFLMTLVHFAILSFRGGALYNYYHHYADQEALYQWLQKIGLTAPAVGEGSGGFLDWIGYIVHPDKSNLADVFNSIINMIGTGVVIVVILLSAPLSKRFGKKAVAVCGFGLAAVGSLAFYLLSPANVWGMIVLTVLIAVAYAPTIPLIWAIYADVADYSEWKTGRRFTGIVFATIGFALKTGLALGSSSFLWIMQGFFGYEALIPPTPESIQGFRVCSGIVVGTLFAVCTVLLAAYQINKRLAIQIQDDLAERRKKFAAPLPLPETP
jgi:Na+/melibiose symporter-like transporter